MAIEWKRAGVELPEEGVYCIVENAHKHSVMMHRSTNFWCNPNMDKLLPIDDDDLYLPIKELAATAKPGAKLYTGEEVADIANENYQNGISDGW